MLNKDKIKIIFSILVILPLLFAFINSYIAKNNVLSWSGINSNTVSYICIVISLMGCLITIYINNIFKTGKFWLVFTSLVFIALIIYLYLGYSISHFGF